MSALLVVRFGYFKINIKSVILLNNVIIAYATNTVTMPLTAGIYTSPPEDFTDLNWFDSQNCKIDKSDRVKLQTCLTNNSITQVTVI